VLPCYRFLKPGLVSARGNVGRCLHKYGAMEGTDAGVLGLCPLLAFYESLLLSPDIDHSSYIWVWKSEAVVYSLILLVTLGVLLSATTNSQARFGCPVHEGGSLCVRRSVWVYAPQLEPAPRILGAS